MKNIECFSVQEVLLTPAIMGNKTKLAKVLGVYRSTIAIYAKDVGMNNHVVFSHDGKWVLRAGK